MHGIEDVPGGHHPVGTAPSQRLDERFPEFAAPRHLHPSHRPLLRRIARYRFDPSRLPLSAVVIPTRRPPGRSSGLALARRIAEATGALLVVLRSGPAVTADRPAAVRHARVPILIIDLPEGSGHLLGRWQADEELVATLHGSSDLGLKRSLGLLLGRMCGWTTALFLDDDIRSTPAGTRPGPVADRTPLTALLDGLTAMAALPELHAAGFQQRDMNDHSVFEHAWELAGFERDVFISGGALLVRIGGPLPRFVRAYNEDWFFFTDLIVQGEFACPASTVRSLGTIHQDTYYPFETSRAAGEELADVFADGTMAMAHLPAAEFRLRSADPSTWTEATEDRRRQHHELRRLLGEMRGGAERRVVRDALVALEAAEAVYRDPGFDAVEALARFGDAMQQDRRPWEQLLASVTPVPGGELSPLAAVDALGLQGRLLVPIRGGRALLRT